MPVSTEAAVTSAAPRRRLSRRVFRGLRWLLLLAGVGAVWLFQGSGGQQLVLEALLGRVESALAGELSVQGIRSGSLLFGATLTGVTLDAEGGRPFMQADSVRLHYSVFGLITGRPTVSGVTLWAPRVEISTYPGDDGPNVRRLLRRGDDEGDSTAAPGGIDLGRIVIHDGLVEILSPAGALSPASRVPTVPLPGGDGLLRRLALENIEGDLRGAVLALAGEVPFAATVRSLAMDVSVLDEPLRLTDASGSFTFGREGIVLEEGAVSLPGSELTGRMRVGPDSGGGPWRFVTDLTASPGALADLRWLDARIPEGTFSGRVEVAAGGGVDVRLHRVEADLEASHLSADGGFRYDGGFELRDLDVAASPLLLSRLDPWLGRASPLQGWLSGRMVFDGTPRALSTRGRVTVVPVGSGGPPTTADLHGVIHFGDDPGATDFAASLDPMSFDVLEAFHPAWTLRGTGAATFSLSGRLAEGIHFTSDVTHDGDSVATSRVVMRGSVQRDSTGSWLFDTEGELAPLSLEWVRDVRPSLELRGVADGSVRATGPLSALRVTGDVDVGGGHLTVDATADVASPAAGYRLSVELDDVDVARTVPAVPSPASWSGRLDIEGRGLTLDSLEGSASLVVRDSRVGGLDVDTVSAALRASAGTLQVDTLYGVLGGMTVGGSGTLGLVASRSGEASFLFATDSLRRLRPFFMGDSVIARDELRPMDRTVLLFEGIDPDTLPLAEDVAMSGALSGTVGLTGNIDDLSLSLSTTLQDGVYRRQSLGTGDVMLEARGLPSRTGEWDVVVDATDVVFGRWTFDGAHVELSGAGRAGHGWFEVRRDSDERYGATGEFALDSAGGRVDLELATLRQDSVHWQLRAPSRISWDSSTVRVTDFEAGRAGDDPGRMAASGILSRTADSDFSLELEGVHVDRLVRLLQLELDEVAGHVDLSVSVTGPADAPEIEARLAAEDPMYGDVSVDRLLTTVRYRDRAATVEAEAQAGIRSIFTAEGTVPVDLSLSPTEDRIPDGVMDVEVRADSVEAAGLLAVVGALEGVEGLVSGEFNVRGTLEEPAPSGSLRFQHGGWTVPALGVRHTEVSGLLTLYPDRTVAVAMASRAAGVSDITGNLDFATLSNPTLDLTLSFQRFQAVDRRDVTGVISGATTVTGTYHRPVIRGSLNVDQGTLFLEEFARSASVVDLTDPRLFADLDTLLLASRPLIAELRNPFMDSLRVDVELAVPRNTWLRSPEMNVEIGGDLIVAYDRGERDLVMVGELEALRGSYAVLGRRFEVESGTVGFIGVPGINPTLDIEAVSRIRRIDDDALDVTANVTGTLIQPRVTLAAQEQGLVEADLVSYLIFGRPTHELATGEQAALGGAVTGAAASVITGTVAAASAAMAQGVVDYLSISQAGDFAGGESFQGSFAQTQVEIGQYLSEDVFVVVVLQPLENQVTGSNTFAGARVEWALSDNLTAEGFIEDRFLRNQSFGVRESALSRRVLGVFVFREWGY